MKNKGLFWMILSIVVVFLAGAVSGVFIDRHFLPRPHTQARRGGPPSIERMARDLNLTTEQQEKIHEIFRKSEERFRELRSNMHESLSQIRMEIKNQIDSVLTPEQRQKFEALIQEHGAPRQSGTDARRKNTQSPPRRDH